MKNKISTILVVFVLLTFLLSLQVKAQQKGLIVSPPTLNEKVVKGQLLSKDFTVINQTGETQNINIFTREIDLNSFGKPIQPEETGDLRSDFEKQGYLKLSKTNFILEDNKSEIFNVTINLPDTLETEGYYFEIFISKVGISQETTVSINSEIAIPVALNYSNIGSPSIYGISTSLFTTVRSLEEKNKVIYALAERQKQALQLASASVEFNTRENIFEYLPIEFFAILENNGNANVIPTGQIFIATDPEMKNIIKTLSFNPANKTIFDNSGREFSTTWDNGPLIINSNNVLSVDLSKLSELRLGKYYAQLTVIWDDNIGKNFETKVTSFWIIPWKFGLGLISLTTLLLVWLLILRPKYILARKKK